MPGKRAMAEPDSEELNVSNLIETKSRRSPAGESPQASARYVIDPDLLIHSPHRCVEPDPRNPERAFIRTENCLFAVFGSGLPPDHIPIVTILAELEAAALATCSELRMGFPDQDALKCAWDQWYEFMLTVSLWNANAESQNPSGCWVRLPGTSELKFAEIFEPKTRETIHRLETRLHNNGAMLVTSNPNLVYLHGVDEARFNNGLCRPMEVYTPGTYEVVVQSYRKILGTCDHTQVRICIGLKSFSRPDRYLWIPYEANILKTLYSYLEHHLGRMPAPLRYYAITSFEPSQSDEESFRAVAPQSILDENTRPHRAVDGLLYVENLSEVTDLTQRMAPDVA